jgi:hypothetical protein
MARALSNAEATALNLWPLVRLAKSEEPVILPSFCADRGIRDLDFVKIDVDGADFLILRSLERTFQELRVLGVGIEVNFFGSDDPDTHTLQNSTQAPSDAGRTAKSLATVIDVSPSASSVRRIVLTPSLDFRARSLALQRGAGGSKLRTCQGSHVAALYTLQYTLYPRYELDRTNRRGPLYPVMVFTGINPVNVLEIERHDYSARSYNRALNYLVFYNSAIVPIPNLRCCSVGSSLRAARNVKHYDREL